MTCPSDKRALRERVDIPSGWFGRPWAAGAYGGGWYGTSKAHGTRLFARPHPSWDWLHAGYEPPSFGWEVNCAGAWMLSGDDWMIYFAEEADAALYMERWWYRGQNILLLTQGDRYERFWSVVYLGRDTAEATRLRLISDDPDLVAWRKGEEAD